MRIARARIPTGQIVYGYIKGDQFRRLAGSPFVTDSVDPPPACDEAWNLENVVLLAPCEPSKIIAVGRNYAAHAAEHGAEVPREPLIFLKPPSAVIGPGEAIVLPPLSHQVEHEAELAVVIGRRARHLSSETALNYVLGYTCGNDVTARDLQRSDSQWSRAKGFDTFCPLGPWIETELALNEQEVLCRVNGEVRQRGHTSQMVFDVPTLLAFVTAVMTLEPGDVLLTGTPAGVSPLQPGDQVEVAVSDVGALRNPVVAERDE